MPKVWALARQSMRVWLAMLSIAVALVAIVQAVMPAVRADAVERSRPKNVPQDAVHVGGFMGRWDRCEYDPTNDVNICKVWNRGGMLLADGVYVPYDRGPAAKGDTLRLVGGYNGEVVIHLRNGRILILESREAEIRKSLDRQFRKE